MIWQGIAFVIAVGVTAAPDILGLSASVADAFHLLGPIAASIAGMAIADVLRGLRRAHIVVGPAIALAPILLGGEMTSVVVGVVAGASLTLLAFPGQPERDKFGGGWPMVLRVGSEPDERDDDRT